MIKVVLNYEFKNEWLKLKLWMDQGERTSLARYLVNILRGNAFYLENPTTGLLYECIANNNVGLANVLTFQDQNKDQFFVFQIVNFIDAIFYKNEVYIVSDSAHIPTCKSVAEDLYNVQTTIAIDSGSKTFGVLFSHTRPYHFFYDQYVNIFILKDIYPQISNQCFADSKIFWDVDVFKKLKSGDNKCKVHLLPLTSCDQIKTSYADEMHISIVNSVKAETLNYDLTLWIGITGQKRSWVEQVEGYVSIVKKLSDFYRNIAVIIDGWTSYLGQNTPDENDLVVVRDIENRLPNVTIINLVGMDTRRKIAFAKDVDYFIANAGQGCMIPLMFCNLKGVLHSNLGLNTFDIKSSQQVKVVPKNKIRVLSKSTPSVTTDYSIHWSVIYNLLAEVMELNDRVVESLSKPLSEEVFSNAFLKYSIPAADILRDVALAFERSGDIEMAYKVMLKAKEQRRNGPLIMSKLNAYSKIINK